MIEHCGTVWGSRKCSYLYGIFTVDHAYIGETGNLPTARWGTHLSKADSSFAEKLRKELEDSGLPEYEGDFLYVGLHCEDIDKEIEEKRKFARLALEHAVHEEFLLRQNKFWPITKLLSTSSKRSARMKFDFDVEKFAKLAVAKLAEEYDQYIRLVSMGTKYVTPKHTGRVDYQNNAAIIAKYNFPLRDSLKTRTQL